MVANVISAKPLYSDYGNRRFLLENKVRASQLEEKASKMINADSRTLTRFKRDIFYLPGETVGTIVDYLV